jgi:hypothetical protein
VTLPSSSPWPPLPQAAESAPAVIHVRPEKAGQLRPFLPAGLGGRARTLVPGLLVFALAVLPPKLSNRPDRTLYDPDDTKQSPVPLKGRQARIRRT